jgi:hypothetical protein
MLKIRNVILYLLLAFLSGCGHMDIKVDAGQYEGKTGVLVAASHLKEQTFLYLVSGVNISFDEKSAVVAPWGRATFIEMNEGKYNYKIWFNYMGAKTGSVQGCVRIRRNSIILLSYKAPFTMLESGNVQVSNLQGRLVDVGC